MLIRASGYNDGVKEYLEDGVKNGRDYTREELDERVILHGDLDLTQLIYQQIPDKGQDRYITFTLSFREDEIP
ncbi:TPA: relaxase, partial [Vibrio vulnificus]|nr:relaxase [Vibrio vulnificus]